MPASGAKLELANVRVLSPSLQFVVAFELSAEPIMNSVLVRAMIPVTRMKTMSMNMKTTPKEPTFINMPRSFLLQIRARATKSTIAQCEEEY